MHLWLLIGLVLCCACKNSVDPVIHDPPPQMPARHEAALLAKANNQFGIDLWRSLAGTTPGNLAISPFSLTTALAMTWHGARGDTAAQVRNVLHFDTESSAVAPRWGLLSRALQDPARPVTLRIANRLFGQAGYPCEPAFVHDTQSAFDAAFAPVPFTTSPDAARVQINDWIEQRTEHRIKDLLQPGSVTRDTRLVLVNAIYFLADWANPFDRAATFEQDFTISATRRPVKTMHATATYRYAKTHGVELLQMPYKDKHLAMLVLLPDHRDGLPDLERSLDATQLAAWTAAMMPAEVRVSLPRFTIDPSQALALDTHLAALGMPAAFDQDAADFTGIAQPSASNERLYISKVLHKAFVKVDEQGTEAAAATAVGVVRVSSMPPPPIPFTADHPFLFAIIDTDSGLVLFLGRVSDPS